MLSFSNIEIVLSIFTWCSNFGQQRELSLFNCYEVDMANLKCHELITIIHQWISLKKVIYETWLAFCILGFIVYYAFKNN